MPDWKRIRAEYDQTTIDWKRINAYAKKVATEIREMFPDQESWLLTSTRWSRESKYGQDTETEIVRTRYLLKAEGSLVLEQTSWSEWIDSRYGYSETPKEVSQVTFDDHAVLMFDFERRTRRIGNVVTDDTPTEKLLVHAKGVGLSKALKELLQRETHKFQMLQGLQDRDRQS